MKNKLSLIICGILISGLSISAVTKNSQPVKYEYMTIIQDYPELIITYNTEKFERLNVKTELKDTHDYRPLLKRIDQLQEQGWEIVQNNVFVTGQGSVPRNYVMLRKVKE